MDGVGRSEEFSMKLEEAIDIKEEVSIKVEDNIDIKDEIQQAVTYPPIKTDHEVRLCGAVWWGQLPPNQAKVLTEGRDLRKVQVGVPLSV
jgi:hypothetical protein